MERREANGYDVCRGRRSRHNRDHATVEGIDLWSELQRRVLVSGTDHRRVNSVTRSCPLRTAEIRCVPPSTSESTASETAAVLGLVSRIASV
jgi:hypothetical protein